MRMELLFIVVFLCFFSGTSLAEDTASQWNMILTRVKLSENWRFFFDTQPRFDFEDSKAHGSSGARQLLVRPAVGYQFSEHWQFYLGYTLVENYSPHATEHDVIQDFLYSTDIGDEKIIQRFRAEQRFLESDGEVAHRWRYMLQALTPSEMSSKLFFQTYDEIFFNMNDVSPGFQSGFGENRAFAGLLYKCTDQTAISAGYQHQYREGRGGKEDNTNHILLLSFFFDFDAS